MGHAQFSPDRSIDEILRDFSDTAETLAANIESKVVQSIRDDAFEDVRVLSAELVEALAREFPQFVPSGALDLDEALWTIHDRLDTPDSLIASALAIELFEEFRRASYEVDTISGLLDLEQMVGALEHVVKELGSSS